MSTNEYPNCKSLIVNVLKSPKFSGLKEARKQFLINVLLCFLSIKGRINFSQLARVSEYCEQYYRIHFENKFNFQDFNLTLIAGRGIKECIVAFDPGYIPKSGKKPFGTGRYWSGYAKQKDIVDTAFGNGQCRYWSGYAKQAKWGLDICGFAVVDVVQKTAFHLNPIQTPPLEDMTLPDYYCRIVKENHLYFKEVSPYLVADAYFSKKTVVDTVLSTGMHFISRLRDDSVLKYIYRGPATGKKGRPKKFDGRVDPSQLDMGRFCETVSTNDLKVYSAIVYSKAFEREINLAVAVFYKNDIEIARKLFFSTDLDMAAEKIVSYYRSRFQIEFLYKLLKERLDMEDFSEKTAKAVKQDFHAKILMMTLCAALSFPIEEKVRAESLKEKNDNEREHEKKINRTSALGMFYDIALGLFIKKDFKNALKAFDEMMMQTCEIIRPGRANPRNHKPKKVYYMNKKKL